MGTTESLAQWIVATSYADIPAAAYEQAKKSILDFLGTEEDEPGIGAPRAARPAPRDPA